MLSKKTQYAFHALIYLAQCEQDKPVLISEIAKKKQIPLKFLESILLELKNKKILSSKKGKHGGYFFAVLPNTVTLAMVYRIVDGPIALLPCISLFFYKKCDSCDETNCGLNSVMKEVRDATLAILERRTIADLIKVQ